MSPEATSPTTVLVNVAELIDQQQIGRFQIWVLVLCASAMFVDGFDTQAIGYVAPALSAALALKPGALGLVFAAGGLGAILGTLGFAPLADRMGRKLVIIGCILFFGLCSLGTSAANTVRELMWMRFVTGLGLGGVVPNALALTADFMPKRFKVTLVLMAWFGFSIGSGVSGPTTAHILLAHSWRAIFVVGGVLPILLVPLLGWSLPESLQRLSQQGMHDKLISATLVRMNPRLVLPQNISFVTERKNEGFPVVMLFKRDEAG